MSTFPEHALGVRTGPGFFNAFSAGSYPKGGVNPFALKVLDALGYPTDDYRSKSWDEFAKPGSRPLLKEEIDPGWHRVL